MRITNDILTSETSGDAHISIPNTILIVPSMTIASFSLFMKYFVYIKMPYSMGSDNPSNLWHFL